jgi:hypothetical protein
VALATRDHHQPAKMVCIPAPSHRQWTRQTNADLNRRVVVNGAVAERTGNHELIRRQLPDAHASC